MPTSAPTVVILVGSDSDLPVVADAVDTLTELGIRSETRVTSAHRTPERTIRLVRGYDRKGTRVFIAGAGGAAHLPGVVAALTRRPVIGIPLDATSLGGLDALLSIVQMPPGIPVGTVGIGRFGAKNAALLAAEILALSDAVLDRRLGAWRERQSKKVIEKDDRQRAATRQPSSRRHASAKGSSSLAKQKRR